MSGKVEKNIQNLKWNVMSKERYDELIINGMVVEDEFYLVQDPVDHNTLKNRNVGFQHTAKTIVFDDLSSLQDKLNQNALVQVSQVLGNDLTMPMSQAAVTHELSKIYAALASLGWQE